MSFARTALRLSAGPIAWALHFAAIYGFTGVACARGLAGAVPWAIGVATLAAGAACVAIVVAGTRRRDEFESWLSAALAGLALLAIAWEAFTALLVRPCA
jgi:hypothetical protein